MCFFPYLPHLPHLKFLFLFDLEWQFVLVVSDANWSESVVGCMLGYSDWLVGGVKSIVFGSIRWCVWSFRPSRPFAVAAP